MNLMLQRIQWKDWKYIEKYKVFQETLLQIDRNRCWATGKPRGVYRDFGLCRNQLRQRAHNGELPGVVKSSW